jgi:hypothetical protein
MKHKLLASLPFPAVFLALASTAVASTWYVNGVSGRDSNNCLSSTTACQTVAQAVSLAASDDTIRLAAALYYENLDITVNLTIVGSGASSTFLDGNRSGRVVAISNTTAHVTLSNLTIRNGYANLGSGGGIYNAGTLTLTKSTVSGNFASFPCSGRAYLWGCMALGGGIYNSGTLTISNSIIRGNSTRVYCFDVPLPCSAVGGGIYNRGTLLTIKNSTLTDNSASTSSCIPSNYCRGGAGGALYSFRGTVTLNNSTVSGSSAHPCSGVCGAIVIGSGILAMNNSTVSGNLSGGIVKSGIATLQNSIVANNSGTNCVGTITSHGYNLSSDGSCAFSNSGDRNNTNPRLGTLGYYGGPTPTIPLLTGSPAIDAGNPSGCTDGHGNLLKTDQRGMPRPDPEDTGGCDMGAYERQSD